MALRGRNGTMPASRMTRIARIPSGPNPRRSAAIRSSVGSVAPPCGHDGTGGGPHRFRPRRGWVRPEDWRKRVGIEPTGAGFPRLPTDLNAAQDTSPDALPRSSLVQPKTGELVPPGGAV